MFKDFKKFLLRGNLVDLVIGFTVGASFSTVAKSLVNDIIMPPVSLLTGTTDFSDRYILLRSATQTSDEIRLNYGMFLNNLFALLIVAFSMFIVIKLINNLDDNLLIGRRKKTKEDDKKPSHKKCPYCYTTIDYKATRCPSCTSNLKIK